MWENEPDEVVEEVFQVEGTTSAKAQRLRKADIFKCLFFPSFGMFLCHSWDNADDVFGAKLIPGPCFHETSVSDIDTSPDMTVCAQAGKAQAESQGRMGTIRGGT